MAKINPRIVSDKDVPPDTAPEEAIIPPETHAELDADEAEFRKLRRDLPGVKGASAAGIVSVGVAKIPGGVRNEFFRTHKEFRPIVPLVDIEVGMEKQYFAVDTDMVVALAGIGITVSEHTLYLTITPRGACRIIPINCTTENEYTRTKEIGLLEGERAMGAALHRPGKQGLQGVPGAGRALRRSHLAGLEASKNISGSPSATRAGWSIARSIPCFRSGPRATSD